MTIDEMSNAFDTLLNSYGNQALFGEGASKTNIVLDEYEKSVYLTQAQDIIVKSYFTPQNNLPDGGFDNSERRQADFSSLIKVITPSEATSTDYAKFDDRSKVFKLEASNNILVILNEKVLITEDEYTTTYVVVPIHYREYDRLMSQAYAQPNKKQVWRLFQNINTGYDIYSEIIPHENLKDLSMTYIVRYVKRPAPIIVTDLSGEGLDIDGSSAKSTNLEIPPSLHRDVINKAVELAYASRGVSSSTQKS